MLSLYYTSHYSERDGFTEHTLQHQLQLSRMRPPVSSVPPRVIAAGPDDITLDEEVDTLGAEDEDDPEGYGARDISEDDDDLDDSRDKFDDDDE